MISPFWVLERYAQTALPYNSSSESATIINPIHPLCGLALTVRQIRPVGKQTRVIFEHPDGGRLSVPMAETSLSLPQPSQKIGDVTPLFDPQKLLRLTLLVSTNSSTVTEQISSSPEHEEIVDRKIDAKTTDNTKNRNRPHRPIKSALNQSDSPVSGKNPRPTTDTANKGED